MNPPETLTSNIAMGKTSSRKGRNSFVNYTFEQWARIVNKNTAQYSTWYSYETQPLHDYISANGWSLKGYHATKPRVYFDFVPFDFDAENDINESFIWAKTFVDYLQSSGISEKHVSVWLSGSKGFHVEVARCVFKCPYPTNDLLRRLKAYVKRIQLQLNIKIDESLYSGGQPYRIPYSRHDKTGLHKTRIKPEDFTEEYIQTRNIWASSPGSDYSIWDNSEQLDLIDLPLIVMEQEASVFAPEVVIDTTLAITANCQKIREISRNPGGREIRRTAAAILMEAYGSSQADEVNALYDAWENNKYMDAGKLADSNKWRGEFEKEGLLKCNKTCSGLGCDKVQKAICGTQTPADHLIRQAIINPISVEAARDMMKWAIHEAVNLPGNPVIVKDYPIGLGKTTELINTLAANLELSAFYAVPTHSLGIEVYDKMIQAGINSIVRIKSRGYLIRQNELICVYPNEVITSDEVSKGTTKKVCMKCPRFPANAKESIEHTPCEYFEQYNDKLKETRVVIGTHQHINKYVLNKIAMENRSFMVIDESPLKAFATEVRAVPADLLAVMQTYYDETFMALREETQAPGEMPEITNNDPGGMFASIRAMAQIEEALKMAEMDQHDYKLLELERTRAQIIYTMIGLVVHGAPLPKHSLEMLESIKKIYPHYYNRFFNKLAEISQYEPTIRLEPELRHVAFPDILSNALECEAVKIPYDVTKTYFFPRLMPNCKTIILDATSSRPLYERLIEISNLEPRELVYNSVPLVEQTHVEVIQVTNSGYSKTRISESEEVMDKLMFVPLSLARTFSDDSILCVSVMNLKAQVTDEMPKRAKMEHFGDLRGKDTYRDYPFEVIIGGFFVSNQAVVEGLQRLGIHTIDAETLEANTISVRNRHTARDGSSYFSKRKGYKSVHRGDAFALANLVLEQASVSEVVQAIRLRFYSGAKDKKVYILTNIGLSRMYADRFVTLDELTVELEDLSGMKSDLDTNKIRRDAMMLGSLKRTQVGEEFTWEDIGEDEKITRAFLRSYQGFGSVQKVPGKAGVFRKISEPGIIQEKKTTKTQVHETLDSWYETIGDNAYFTVAEMSDAAGSTSVRHLNEWIQIRVENKMLIPIGEKRGRRYKKSQFFTEMFDRSSL